MENETAAFGTIFFKAIVGTFTIENTIFQNNTARSFSVVFAYFESYEETNLIMKDVTVIDNSSRSTIHVRGFNPLSKLQTINCVFKNNGGQIIAAN